MVALRLSVVVPAHHHVHQESAGRVGSFWGASGAIRRDLLLFLCRGGLRLAVTGFLLPQLYYLYSWLGPAFGVLAHPLDRTPRSDLEGSGPRQESGCG